MKLFQTFLMWLTVILGFTANVAFGATVMVQSVDHCSIYVNDSKVVGTNDFTLTSGGTMEVEVMPEKGYAFWYWITTINQSLIANNPLTINFSDLTLPTHTLMPVMREIYYTQFYLAGDEDAEGEMASERVSYLTGTELPDCGYELEHHKFVGWVLNGVTYAAGERVQGLVETYGGQVVFTAKWEQDEFEVTFDKNNSAAVLDETNGWYREGERYGVLPTPSAADLGFEGWYTSKEYETRVTVDSICNSAVKRLYAKWRAKQYTIKFHANGGTGSMATQVLECAESSQLSANQFVRTGYDFAGWKVGDEGKVYEDGEEVERLAADDGATVMMYAQWKAHTYTVKFDSDGGEGTMADQAFVYGEGQELASNKFTHANVEFRHWKGEDGTIYEDGAVVSNLTSAANGEVTLKAIWEEKYWVRFDGNGAQKGTMATIEFETASEEKALPTNLFERLGYRFKQWVRTDKARHYLDGEKVHGLGTPGQTITLKAEWAAQAYQVVFHANADYYRGETDAAEMEYGAVVVMPACGSKNFTGEFVGWARNPKSAASDWAAGDRVRSLSSMANEVVHLHAIWKDLLTDYSRAVGCDKVVLVSGTNAADVAWIVGTDGVVSGAAKDAQGSRMEATLGENGLLTFDWKVASAADSEACGFYFVNGEEEEELERAAEAPLVDWTSVQVQIVNAPGDVCWVSKVAREGALSVRNVRWYPIDGGAYSLVRYFENTDGAGDGRIVTQRVYAVSKESVIENPFKREGWMFTGWTGAADGTGNKYERGDAISYAKGVTVAIYAQWKAAISFDANGGEGAMLQIALERNVATNLPACAFTREGYTFEGWATNGVKDVVYTNCEMVAFSEPTTLKAVWSRIDHVIYCANIDDVGGGHVVTQRVVGATVKAATNTFTRAGWVFKAWNTKANGSGDSYVVGAELPYEKGKDLKVYAQWAQHPFIQFDANDGDGEMAAIEVEVGDKITLPICTFTRAGYVFVGWAKSLGSKTADYYDGATITIREEATTLYAVWNEHAVITYYENTDGQGGGGRTKTQEVTVGSKTIVAESNTWERTGWHFVNWNEKADGSGKPYDEGAAFTYSMLGGLKLYAQWVPVVRFNANGGTGEKMETIRASATATGYVVDLPKCTFTRERYEFAGWATTANASEVKYEDNTSFEIAEPLTLYAVWKRQIIYVSNDGDDDKEIVQDVYGSTIYASTNLFEQAEGWVLKGWTMDADAEGTDTVYLVNQKLPDDLATGQRLYAKWNLKVSFNANDGTGTMEVQEVERNKAKALSACTFTREGYKFAGWTRNADSEYVEYVNGGTITIAEPITLYAVWMDKNTSEFNQVLGCDTNVVFTTTTSTNTAIAWSVYTNNNIRVVRSGYGESSLEAKLPGAGMLTFKWKIDVEDAETKEKDVYQFCVDGKKQDGYQPTISGGEYTYTCNGVTTVSWVTRVLENVAKDLRPYLLSVSWTPDK